MLGVISWNVRYFAHGTRGITSLDRTLKRVATVLASLDPQPDVIALQEIDDLSIRSSLGRTRRRQRDGVQTSQLDRFVTALNHASRERAGHIYQSEFFGAQGRDAKFPLYSTGLALLYRSSLVQLDHNGPSPHEITFRRIKRLGKMKQKRICAWSRFRHESGKVFDLYNTHLSLPAFLQLHGGTSGSRFGEAENQVRETESVLNFVSSRGRADASILVGDFNALPGSRVYTRIVREDTLFHDAHARYLGAGPKQLQKMPSAGFMNLRYRLDHIFCCSNVRFSTFENTAPYGKEHPWGALSDHSPLAGRFDIG